MERRGFLKALAGAGLGAGMLSAWGAATPAQAAGLEDCLAVVVDVDACTGCGACVQACHERAAARVPQPVSPIPASRWGRDRKPDWWGRRNVTDRLTPYNWLYLQSCTVQTARGERRVFMPRRCLQCLNPPCVSLCPLGAARQRPTGAVYTEMSLCFGDSQCIAVCPWHIPCLQAGVGPYLHLAPGYLGYGQTFKCDFCEDIISDGKPPLCVASFRPAGEWRHLPDLCLVHPLPGYRSLIAAAGVDLRRTAQPAPGWGQSGTRERSCGHGAGRAAGRGRTGRPAPVARPLEGQG